MPSRLDSLVYKAICKLEAIEDLLHGGKYAEATSEVCLLDRLMDLILVEEETNENRDVDII
jgi:hypothetical protein